MKVIQEDLWICDTCLCPVVNGDLSGLSFEAQSGEEEEVLVSKMHRDIEALPGNLVPDFDDGDGEEEFSSEPCECCGTARAGGRYRFAVLGDGGEEPPTEDELATMLDAYITCALWSSNDWSGEDEGDPLDKDYSASDIHEKTMATMREDCERFAKDNVRLIAGDYAQAGHDLWLTRNGHGTGFWDRGSNKSDYYGGRGKSLSKRVNELGFREVDIYVGDDGVIYQSGSEP